MEIIRRLMKFTNSNNLGGLENNSSRKLEERQFGENNLGVNSIKEGCSLIVFIGAITKDNFAKN